MGKSLKVYLTDRRAKLLKRIYVGFNPTIAEGFHMKFLIYIYQSFTHCLKNTNYQNLEINLHITLPKS